MKIGKYIVELSSEDKIFFPDAEIVKGDIISYYMDVYKLMQPFLQNRPVMIERFPDGIDAEGFYQKSVSDYFPNYIDPISVEKEDGNIEHISCNSKAALVYLANQGTITFHNWLSSQEALDSPKEFVIDLDPPGGDFEIAREGALIIREFLGDKSISSFVKTTGSEGLHIHIPIKTSSNYDEVREVAKELGESLAKQYPDVFTMAQRKDERKGKLFFDIHAMAYGQTSVTPYSIRPIKNAPIATPLDWSELKEKDLGPQSYHLKNIRKRLSQKKNPWKGYRKHAIAIKRLYSD
mgnify:CR=1 FL=1